MSEIVVVARANAQPGREDEMERALVANAKDSRAEAGCISYAVLRGDNGLFMTLERWKSKADLDQHMQTPHVQTLFGALRPLLAGPPDLQVLTEV
jgi:quinol monooxygenase YgiN